MTDTMTKPTTTTKDESTVSTVVNTTDMEEDYQDRFLDGSQQIIPFDLLDARGKADDCDDPSAKVYKEAKELFHKGYELCMSIPRTLDDEVLNQYEDEIRTASETMVEAWLMDDKAAPMSERILILGQQYEKVLLKHIPEEEKEGFFVKDSLLFSAWILLVGKQYKHCASTLTIAIDTYHDLPARVFYLRASCHLSMNKTGLGIKDLETALKKDPNFHFAHFLLGSIYSSMGNDITTSIKHYELYLNESHPASNYTVHAYYALSVLLSGQRKRKLAAAEYYHLGKAAEEKFIELYGIHTGLSDIKRQAISLFETPQEANRLIEKYTSKKQRDEKMQKFIQSGLLQASYPPNPNKCSHCAAGHVKDSPDTPLLTCGACRGIWYCSRECQVADYKSSHKNQCKKFQALKSEK
ncbi:hypothetical protein BDB01DRAFT_780183 [Pilobolus umbonatus]|nr:hypothetical protein BDB01DRAFT_780183 [Pilobolus umbonatus]